MMSVFWLVVISILAVVFTAGWFAGLLVQANKQRRRRAGRTLYEWQSSRGGAWVDTDEMRDELIADGVLVEVDDE